MDERIVLGIDPGSRITGFGIIRINKQGKPFYLTSGCIRLGSGPFPHRLHLLYDALAKLYAEYPINEVAVEEVFVAKNAQSALKLGQARGVILLAAAKRGCEIFEYTPRRIKQTIVGFGGAEKGQIQAMVQHHLGLNGLPQVDAADALAVALCHHQHARFPIKV